ncbi:MAG TPA: 3,4-dihydroxy-2-butanone-4-phosphate synthase [Alphaproteobacteria bacterium]|jgi:3,4-dihydroxy 2-butanone 4-phosphate synthase/GTP cyclohydrolase II|nr:3,4-dihydroxy-2-butanone-4-phosphate synthase [Alphaproteobacteria bacterium]
MNVVADSTSMDSPFSPIEDLIDDARNGRMFVLVDDEGRENEGDLIVPAEFATPEAINFMARHGRGLVCLALSPDRATKLELEPMQRRNVKRFDTAFTVSIEATDGVSTGISASDRAHTIHTAIDPRSTATDITTPGHVFPIVARDGGVLVRAGHTEAAVDVARLAGLEPAGVICEIMNDDGSMARRDDLIAYCQKYGLKIGTIADLIAYRRRVDRVVERVLERDFESRWGGSFRMIVYVNTADGTEHAALVKGNLGGDAPVLVRMHRVNPLIDIMGDTTTGRGDELHRAMELIAEEGRGVVVVIRAARPDSLSTLLEGHEIEPDESGGALRAYGTGAQILLDLGIREMVLLSNSERIVVGLGGFGLSIAGRRPIKGGD